MLKSVTQIYCKECHSVKKKCSNILYPDLCFGCYRTRSLHSARKKYLFDLESVPETVTTADETATTATASSPDLPSAERNEDEFGSVKPCSFQFMPGTRESVSDSVEDVDSEKSSSSDDYETDSWGNQSLPSDCTLDEYDEYFSRFAKDGVSVGSASCDVEDCFSDGSDYFEGEEEDWEERDDTVEEENDTTCTGHANSVLEWQSNEELVFNKYSCQSKMSPEICCNCMREALADELVVNDAPEYHVMLSEVPKNTINFKKKKGRLIRKKDLDDVVVLCRECCNVLIDGMAVDKDRLSWRNQWPSYVWSLLSGVDSRTSVGDDIIKFLPSLWLKYWARSLITVVGYSLTSLCKYISREAARQVHVVVGSVDSMSEEGTDESFISVDVTTEHRDFVAITKRLKLGELKKGCDKYLIPRILCPWGCTTYLHRVGYVSFDALVSKFLSSVKCAGSFSSEKEKKKVESSRNDFFSDVIDMHLHNPEWTIHPSVIYWKDVGPVFATCKDHHRGTVMQYFHLPRSSSCLPCLSPESLSHAVLNARTIKPTVRKMYSNSYQLQKVSANYCGLDTCYVTDRRCFDNHSLLKDLNECRSYFGREDIRGLTNKLSQNGQISPEMASDIQIRSSALFDNSLFADELVFGGTMMTLTDCMNLQKMLSEPQTLTMDVFDKTQNRYVTRDYKRLWASRLVRIHPNDIYGSTFTNVGACTDAVKDSRLLWSIMHMACHIGLMWEALDGKATNAKGLEGQLLAYCAKHVLNQGISTSDPTHPFFLKKWVDSVDVNGKKIKKVVNVNIEFLNDLLLAKFKGIEREKISSVFAEHNEIYVSSIPQDVTPDNLSLSITGGEHKILILYHGDDYLYERNEDICLLNVEGHQYELRMIIESCTTEKQSSKKQSDRSKRQKIDGNSSSNDWKGAVFCRHGTSCFPGWWKMERGHACYRVNDLAEVQWNFVDFLVYVLLQPVDLQKYRTEYLKYIGGQTKAFCKEHNVPFIVTASARGTDLRSCTFSETCGKAEKYYCPVIGCSNRICQKCFASLETSTFIQARSVDDSANLSDSIIDNFCIEEGANRQNSGEPEELEAEDCDSLNSADSLPLLDFDYGTLHTGADLVIEDIEDAVSIRDEEDDGFEQLIPTTNCSKKSMEFDGSLGFIGSNVLLNKVGTMLVRQPTQLQASRRERNIIERVASVDNNGTVPLVFLEGMLFPSIFWNLPNSSEGGILGSMPTALFCRNETRRQMRVASVAEHLKLRLKCAHSSTATDPRYLSFGFDCLANGALAGQDTRVVLSRGFEASMGPAGLRVRNEEDAFFTDTIDNRQNVHNLAAMEYYCPSQLFITLTCNQQEHFGVKNVKRYSSSEEAIRNYELYLKKTFPAHPGLNSRMREEVRKSFCEAARNLIVRNWFEVRLLLIDYFSHSPEKPLGNVTKIFVRDEYQHDVGNLSHLHMLVSLTESYDDIEGRRHIQKLIRAIIPEIVGEDEVEQYIEEGLLDDWLDYQTMKDQAAKFLPHTHSDRCMRRTGTGDGDLKCRVPDPLLLSKNTFEFYEYNIDVPHSPEALDIMEKLGLCENRSENGGNFVPLHDFLKAKRILPPVKFGEGNVSPVIGRVFAATRSTMNIQICTSFGTSRYIVKYLIKIDENNYVVFSGNKNDPTVASAERIHLNNTKISSSAMNEAKKLALSRNRNKPKGRQIAATEQMQLILGYPQIHTNMECIRVSTLPLAERAGFERLSPTDAVKDFEFIGDAQDAFEFCVPCVKCREDLFKHSNLWRRHTSSQVIMLRDQMDCPVSLDRVFIFGVRPPELLLIDKLEWYFRFFKREKSRAVSNADEFKEFVKRDLEASSWIDGLGYEIQLRHGALGELKKVLQESFSTVSSVSTEKKKMVKLLKELCDLGLSASTGQLTRIAHARWKRLKCLFIYGNDKLPVPVFSNVKPLNAPRFIIHVLLSMGRFETESDLWSNSSLSDAFVNAKLITEKTETEVEELLRKWILRQLRFYPIGSKKMDEFIVSARTIFYCAVIQNDLPMSEIPPYLYNTLVREVDENIMKFLDECKTTLIRVTRDSVTSIYGQTSCPSTDDFLQATKSRPLQWNGLFERTQQQSIESFGEQREVQYNIQRSVQQYIESRDHAAKNYIICGPPGSGKTHCMSQSILYCVSQGLFCMTTAILADRALVLGGRHVHKLFGLKVRDSGTPHRLAELAVIALQKKPELVALLRALDVIFFDELGQLSAEQVAILDLVLRRIRDSNLFLGGVLLIGTIDQHQLRPIKGLPFLLSPFVLTSFWMGKLKHYVRCAECKVLQEMNTIARTYLTDPVAWTALLQVFENLVRQHCTFVSDWNDPIITDNVIRIFPRRHQTARATDLFVKKKIATFVPDAEYVQVEAEDSMNALESHGDWKVANESCKKFLNRKSNEPATLYLYIGGVYEFTYNKAGHFNTTQLGVLMDLPAPETVEKFKDFEIFVAPAGCKCFDIEGKSKDQLLLDGWRKSKASTAPQYSLTVWKKGIKVRRKQYGMKLHVSSTIHSAIGNTLGKVASSLEHDGLLWERAMVVVLISRVSFAKDLIFVGDKEDNIRALIHGLRVRDQFAEYMNHIVDVLVSSAHSNLSSIPLNLSNHPFRPRDIELPHRNEGTVYMLLSARDRRALYVGQTLNLEKRIKSHNSGYGSSESSDPAKRPWALFAYVTGFLQDRATMRRFEKNWQDLIQFRKPGTPYEAVQLGMRILNDTFGEYGLRMITAKE